ncbi:hypothetical protein [Erwinia aeris]|uniref:hypothetical protein n=1 Tax=Erwinia aeris TaxID=3239803 RepID=UPI0035126090
MLKTRRKNLRLERGLMPFLREPGAGRLADNLATDSAPVVDPTPSRYARLTDGSGQQQPGMI